MTYVFLGGFSETPGMRLTQFGQRFEATPELVTDIEHRSGIPAIPADRFDAIGFTPEELKKYASAASHWRIDQLPDGTSKVVSAPESFLEKKKKALDILHEIRTAKAEEGGK